MRRDEGESTKFLCDLRLGHAAIAFRLSRLQAPLDGERALELGHHILKAHVYRGVTPCWPSRDLQVRIFPFYYESRFYLFSQYCYSS